MVNVYSYINYREYLTAYFEDRKKRDSKFSHRYFARRLGIASPTFMMLVMQGKRNITQSLTFKISEELKHNNKEVSYFEGMVGFIQAKSNKEKDKFFNRMLELRRNCKVEKIEESQYDYYSNWYNIPIRELVVFSEFKGDYKWLAKKLIPSITPVQAKRSVELLLKLGLIKKKGKNFEQTSRVIGTAPEISNLGVANFHRKMTQIAEASLDNIPKEERDNTACTISIFNKGFNDIKKALTACRKKVLSIAVNDIDVDRVFQLNLQLFPVSGKEKK